MKGPPPKPAALRQRRNRTTTAALLISSSSAGKQAPPLPRDRDWHKMTRAWWHDVWHSPMATEFLRADMHGLYRVAVLVDRFWVEGGTTLAAEIRQEQAAYGLTPIDRRRLQWEVERVESAVRKRQRPAASAAATRGDPRELLRMVK